MGPDAGSSPSFSQIGQDRWVVERTGGKKGGFFVEAGATDGITLSNTYLLETEYGWSGICCEPNPRFFDKLKGNRNCMLEDLILYDIDGLELDFYLAGELGGTEDDFMSESARYSERISSESIKKTTISLNSLLLNHSAPSQIDYISLDTEGSEYRILSTFDFSRWDVSIFSIEHNRYHREDGEENLEKIIQLMGQNGYDHEFNKWDMFFFRESEK